MAVEFDDVEWPLRSRRGIGIGAMTGLWIEGQNLFNKPLGQALTIRVAGRSKSEIAADGVPVSPAQAGWVNIPKPA